MRKTSYKQDSEVINLLLCRPLDYDLKELQLTGLDDVLKITGEDRMRLFPDSPNVACWCEDNKHAMVRQAFRVDDL